MARSKASAPSPSCATFRPARRAAPTVSRSTIAIASTSPRMPGVQVFDAKGDYLGTIKLSRQPANVAFAGPDRQTLYITARQGLYRVKMLSRGPDRPGK